MTSIAPATRDPFDFPVETKSVTYKGVKYNFRELTVAENDVCREAATGPGPDDYDGRTMMRMMVVTAATEPALDSDRLGTLPQRLYARFVEIVNDLNDPDKFEEDPGNS